MLERTVASRASELPQLRSNRGGWVSGGIQRFHSRPDLLAPEVVIDTPARRVLDGLVVTETHLGPSQAGPLIVGQSGRIVWFSPVASDPTSRLRAFNVRVQSYRGQPVLCWFEGIVTGSHGEGYGLGSYTIRNSRYEEIAHVSAHDGYQGDLHEFLLTPEGTALFTCYGQAQGSIRTAAGTQAVPYLYGVIQEVDVASGELVWSWRSDRHIALTESYAQPVLKPGWVWDYMHLNSISIDPSDGNLVVSGRNTCACYKLERKSGRVMWRLGGKQSDFRLAAGTRFHYQHDVNIHPGGLMTVFDNEGGPPQFAAHSRALVLVVDERQKRVRLVHDFHHSPQVYSNALGSVQPLGDDTWFVGWGRSTNFTQYGGDGRVEFDGHLSAGSSSYRAFLQPWDGRPTAPPDIAVVRSGSDATVYASWNGSTELAGWTLLGGSSPGQLKPLGRTGLAGFETAISIASAPACLAVSACSQSGQVLATSHVATDA